MGKEETLSVNMKSWRSFHDQTLRRKGRQTFHFMLNLCMVDGLKYSVLTVTVNS